MQADNDVHAESRQEQAAFFAAALNGKITQAHGASLSNAFATAKDALALLQVLSLEPTPASIAAAAALAPAPPASGWHFRRTLQELDRLALKLLYAYYGQPFALPSVLAASGPLNYWQQSRRLARAIDPLCRHIEVVEAHPRAGHMQVKLHLQLARIDSGLVCDLFVAITHERRIAVSIPLLCHVRHRRTVGPHGFVPVLLVYDDGQSLTSLAPDDVGPTFAQRGSLHFKRPELAFYDSPFLPKNAEATGSEWSVQLLCFNATGRKYEVNTLTNPQDVAEAARAAQA